MNTVLPTLASTLTLPEPASFACPVERPIAPPRLTSRVNGYLTSGGLPTGLPMLQTTLALRPATMPVLKPSLRWFFRLFSPSARAP